MFRVLLVAQVRKVTKAILAKTIQAYLVQKVILVSRVVMDRFASQGMVLLAFLQVLSLVTRTWISATATFTN